MKIAIELIKIVLLSAIALLLSIEIGFFEKKIPVLQESKIVSEDENKIKREDDLKKVIENKLARLFKYPESVRFKNTNIEYKRVFHDAGIDVEFSNEFELATLCGEYSAPNAMGLYGPFEPFYGEIYVNNSKKGFSGKLMFKNDGEVKELVDLDYVYPLKINDEVFEKLYSKNCGELDNVDMGVLSSYELLPGADISFMVYNEMIGDFSKYPEIMNDIQSCIKSGAAMNYCLYSGYCQTPEKLKEHLEEFCLLKKELCSENESQKDCEKKINAAYEEKNQ